MKKVLLILSLFYSSALVAQDATIYTYDRNGFRTKSATIEYEKPLFGSSTYPTSTYVPQYDINLYGKALIYKQQQYNNNLQSLQNYVNQLWEAINELGELDYGGAETVAKQLNDYLQSLNGKVDYSNTNIYNAVLNNLNIIKINITRFRQYAINKLRNTSTVPAYATQSRAEENVLSGTIQVYTCTSLTAEPKAGSETVKSACNGRVKILSKFDNVYYYVECEGVKGYIMKGYIKE